MGQSQTKQVSGELERLLLELRRELVEEEGETAADKVVLNLPAILSLVIQCNTPQQNKIIQSQNNIYEIIM